MIKSSEQIRHSFETTMTRIQAITGKDEKFDLLMANGPEYVEPMWNKYAALYESGYKQALQDMGLPLPAGK
jgi:hypothetical protein